MQHLDKELNEELETLESQSLRRVFHKLSGPQDTWITIDNKWCLNLSSNNYLGLADHPLVVEAATNTLAECGAGAGASRLISGNLDVHGLLEERLAQFKQSEAALVYPTGYMANLGVITALVGKGDLVVLDKLDHASLVDAARLSGATLRVYQHRDLKKLKSVLANAAGKHRRTMVITDGVFSMDGDIPPLPEIVELAARFEAIVLVDDAHGTGVLGEQGRGTVAHFSLPHDCCIQVGTLSKALGSLGGFVCGSRILIDYLRNRSRPLLYTTGLPASAAGAALAALALVEGGETLRQDLRDNVTRLVAGLRKNGVPVESSETPIIPLIIGESDATLEVSRKLFDAGIYCPALRPPTVPEGTARLRVSLMATHTDEDIKLAVETLAQTLKP